MNTREPNTKIAAGFYPGQEMAYHPVTGQQLFPDVSFEHVQFTGPVPVQHDGYVYIWLSNESENTKVWFDDLRVTHTQTRVTRAADYGVWGEVLREMKSDEITYRYGYQGQYAEHDEETGWSAFELRQYDPIIGRWTTTDPFGQFHSPYVGMGNDPINSIDHDGGYSKFWAKWHNFWQGGNGAYLAGMDGNREVWGFDTDLEEGIGIHSHFGKDARNNYTDAPTIQKWKPNLWQQWEMSDTWYANMSYETLDALYVTGRFFTPWHKPTHIDGQEVIGDQGAEALVSSAATLIPYTKLGKVSKMTAPQFSKLFKGTLSRLQPKTRGFINRQINKQVIEKPHEAAINGTGAASTLFNDDN